MCCSNLAGDVCKIDCGSEVEMNGDFKRFKLYQYVGNNELDEICNE